MKNRMLFVIVSLANPKSALHDDDVGITGVYEIFGIDPSMTDNEAAESALETFHVNNGIHVLDDFDIDVIDPFSKKVLETGETEHYQEFDCSKLSDEIPSWIDDLIKSSYEPQLPSPREDDLSPGF